MNSIGDMARALVLRTNQVRLRQDMDRLATEVATGEATDKPARLAGDTTPLLALDRSLARLETFRINTAEAKLVSGAMQIAMEQIQSRSEQVAQSLLGADLTPSPALLQTLSGDAADALEQAMGELNRSVAGRFLFSGAATDGPALQDTDTMLADLRTALTGLTTLPDIETALDAWFDGPTGGFQTSTYVGSTAGSGPMRLGETESAQIDIRADDAAFRALLKPLAAAALAADPTLGLSVELQSSLLSKAGRDVLFAQEAVVELRAGLGSLEARIEETATRNAAERTAASIARNELISTDPYETATRYEEVRSQLESLYAITARSSRLSLAEFLR
ncbi:flagellar biosynthesis protein FlgL [Thalassococcus sp. CAU 1522]|uniref:Flagellar biosynthesis protein FlgL n=1 Tax=Thalassococcus arenae TaxID=2851652 RepID=A0ABS6N5Q6_9RHOB|nr:flagellin [Thalassococcus arenae]MBV2359348.1 flagellar biosynthesis protein FlgL [Thalassococcus arenae]